MCDWRSSPETMIKAVTSFSSKRKQSKLLLNFPLPFVLVSSALDHSLVAISTSTALQLFVISMAPKYALTTPRYADMWISRWQARARLDF